MRRLDSGSSRSTLHFVRLLLGSHRPQAAASLGCGLAGFRTNLAELRNTGSLSMAIADVVDLGAADIAGSDDFNFLVTGRVDGENALNRDAVAVLADGE